MGLPVINIAFQTLAVSAVKRSERGIVAMLVKDNTNALIDSVVYKDISEINSQDWNASTKDYIEKTFLGTPYKIIVQKVATDALDYNDGLAKLKNKAWNYLTIPQLQTGEAAAIASWIKSQRTNEHKSFKAVLPDTAADSDGIVNFTTKDIKVGEKTYTTAEYCCRIAGILAGMPFTRSATYYVLNEVDSITEHADPNADIDNGELVLINDTEKIKIGRGVNSLTTTSPTKSSKFKKIRIVEAIDLMRDDIRTTFNDEYVGKVNNKYTNKQMFVASVLAYLKTLQREEVLDSDFPVTTEIDFEAQKLYIMSTGVDTSAMSEQEILKYNTGSKVFIKASASPLDAMEDLDFSMLVI